MTNYIFAAIIGIPNVGKSTLLNSLVEENISIVTNKPQTTRNKIIGIITKKESQYIFIDTPGIHKPKNKLDYFMDKQSSNARKENDLIIFVTDATKKLTSTEKNILEELKKSKNIIIVFNKMDLLNNEEEIFPKIKDIIDIDTEKFKNIIKISAKENNGINTLFNEINKYLVEGPHFFPDDALTDQPEKVLVSEFIRQKILENLREEIPHGVAVTIEKMSEREDKDILDIDATIICEKNSHKGIIIGKNGIMLKKIMTESRMQIESFFECQVNLHSWVKIKENWRESEILIKNFGYVEEK